jgi:CheY-like chemotaxis protein
MSISPGIPFLILIVEDDEDDRIIIDEAFEEIGYASEVKKFINGQSLIEYLEKMEPKLYPSLIVLDNSLPQMDASQLLTSLKNDSRYTHIPIIVYASSVSPQKKEKLMSMGAYACIEKEALMDNIIAVAKQLRNVAEAQVRDPLPGSHGQ